MNMSFINPQQIRSPYTGETSRPTISNYEQDGKTYEQAVFTDPVTGHIIKKGLISVKDSKTGELIADFNTEFNKNITTQSRG